MKDPRIKDFVSMYQAPKQTEPFFGFFRYGGNSGSKKKKQRIEKENKRFNKIRKAS